MEKWREGRKGERERGMKQSRSGNIFMGVEMNVQRA